MKSTRILVVLGFALMLFASCKKQYPPVGCKPSHKPCPPEPRAVGMAYLYQGKQVGSHIFTISIYYTNSIEGSGILSSYINGKDYYDRTNLNYGDITNLGSYTFTIALQDSSFTDSLCTIITLGYNSPQRCDCDPTEYTTTLSIKVPAQNTFAKNSAGLNIAYLLKPDLFLNRYFIF